MRAICARCENRAEVAMNELDFKGLANTLLADARGLLQNWFPEGKMMGKEFCVGDLRGGSGDSLRINMNTGVWKDFASDNEAGGDLIALYAAKQGIGQGEAFKELAQQFGHNTGSVATMDKPRRKPKPPEPEPVNEMPPAEAPEGQFDHAEWGKPVEVNAYRDLNGKIMFYTTRYEPLEKGKQFLPWTWKDGRWVAKGWQGKRPLFGQEMLAEKSDRPILIVEGEKCVHAARKLFGNRYTVLTWCGGANAWEKAMWDNIRNGSEIVFMRDNDDSGEKAELGICCLLVTKSCLIKTVDVSDQEKGWDIADGKWEDWKEFYAWVVPRVKLFEPPAFVEPVEEPEPEPEPKQVINLTQNNLNIFGDIEDHAIATKTQQELWDQIGFSLAKSSQQPMVNYDNVLRGLENFPPLQNLLWYDEFHDKFFTKDRKNVGRTREWMNSDDEELAIYFQRALGIGKMSKDIVATAVSVYGRKHTRNEPRDWFDSLKWDGEERLSKFFFRYYGTRHSVYSQMAGLNFWIGMVARVYKPGCKLDHMIVLEGPQGCGKSSSLEIIGGNWMAVASQNVQDKDFYQVLKGKLIIEIAELDSFSKAEVAKVKQVISTPTDRYRASYERRAADHPRMSVFVATTNEDSYLRDNTGARRFWPMPVLLADFDLLIKDREQLFAQAVHMFKQGEEWWHMPTLETKAEQEIRRQSDDWEQVIENYLRIKDETTGIEVAVDCLKFDVNKIDRATQMRVAGCLHAIKWCRKPLWRDGKKVNGWVPRQKA